MRIVAPFEPKFEGPVDVRLNPRGSKAELDGTSSYAGAIVFVKDEKAAFQYLPDIGWFRCVTERDMETLITSSISTKLEELSKEVTKEINGVKDDMKHIREAIETLEQGIETLEQGIETLEQGIEGLEQRIEGLENRDYESIITRLANLESRLEGLEV